MASECHAIEVVNADFDTTCQVMTTHGAAILDSSSRRAAIQFRQDAPPGSGGIGRLVISPLAVERDGWATICMHWLAEDGEDGHPVLSAWMRGALHVLRGRGAHAPVTELLLTVRCDIGPSGRFHDDPRVLAARMVTERVMRWPWRVAFAPPPAVAARPGWPGAAGGA